MLAKCTAKQNAKHDLQSLQNCTHTHTHTEGAAAANTSIHCKVYTTRGLVNHGKGKLGYLLSHNRASV